LHHKTATCEQSKDTYGQTIKQSTKPNAPETLPETEKIAGENEKSREVKTRGLSTNLLANQKAVRVDGLFLCDIFLNSSNANFFTAQKRRRKTSE
jgi:hypothetical protein